LTALTVVAAGAPRDTEAAGAPRYMNRCSPAFSPPSTT